MKVLYISSKPAYPSVDGGCKAIQRFLDALMLGGHDITHLTFETHKHPFILSAWPLEIMQGISVQSISIDTQIKVLPMLWKSLKGRSYHLSRFCTPALEKKLQDLLTSGSFEAVILDGLYSAACIDTIRAHTQAKIYVRTHNVEHNIWKSLATNANKSPKTYVLRILADSLQKEELNILNAADGIFSISPEDTKAFKQLGIQTSIADVPFSMEPGEPSKATKANAFFFIGGMDWLPNKEAVELLISDIFPQIKEKIPTAELHIAGKGTEHYKNGDSIYFHGFVADSMKFMRDSGMLLLPLKSGSGVRIKLLEAMSLGIPVVTTSIGKEGIEASNCMQMADTTDNFVAAAIALNDNALLKAEFAHNSRSFIEEHYSTKTIARTLNEILR